MLTSPIFYFVVFIGNLVFLVNLALVIDEIFQSAFSVLLIETFIKVKTSSLPVFLVRGNGEDCLGRLLNESLLRVCSTLSGQDGGLEPFRLCEANNLNIIFIIKVQSGKILFLMYF